MNSVAYDVIINLLPVSSVIHIFFGLRAVFILSMSETGGHCHVTNSSSVSQFSWLAVVIFASLYYVSVGVFV